MDEDKNAGRQTNRQTISYPQDLHDIIEAQVADDVASSTSEWIRDAITIRLSLQDLAFEAGALHGNQEAAETYEGLTDE